MASKDDGWPFKTIHQNRTDESNNSKFACFMDGEDFTVETVTESVYA